MKTFGRSPGHWLASATGVVLATALIACAVSLGVALRLYGSVSPMPTTAAPDYGRGPADNFSPLRAEFIRSALGDVVPLPLSGGITDMVASPRPKGGAAPARLVDHHPLTNDDVAGAKEIPAIPFTGRTNTRAASRESGEPSDCAVTGPTVWYRYTSPENRAIIANTFGSDHVVALGVFTGRPGGLLAVGCDTDAGGNALVAFTAAAAETYYLQATAPLGGGDLVLNVDPHGMTSLASRSSWGERGDGGNSRALSVSSDGRYVAFASTATNLAPGVDPTTCVARDPAFGFVTDGPCPQIYVHDRLRDSTELISKTSAGDPGNSTSWSPFLSADGRYVTYESAASNLDPGDIDGGLDLFVYDRASGVTERIPAVSSSPLEYVGENYGGLFHGSISDDGRYVAFNSPASDLVPGGRDTNGNDDVFVYDRQARTTERVSVSSSGGQLTGASRPTGDLYPSISSDGRYVTFITDAPSLVQGDTNGVLDMFIHDRTTHITERVSVSATGQEGNGTVWEPGYQLRRISADGRYVAFSSSASNLVPSDTNNDADVFVRDRVASTTIRVSVSSTGGQAIGATDPAVAYNPYYYSISGDGRYVAFDSSALGLTPSDTAKDWDVFVHDVVTRTTTLVTISPAGDGTAGEGACISPDGRAVAYLSGRMGDRTGGGFEYGKNDVLVFESSRA